MIRAQSTSSISFINFQLLATVTLTFTETECGAGARVLQWNAVGGGTPHQHYEVIARYPHDSAAFTEGLVFHGKDLYESTGLYGGSSLRRIEPATGRILARRNLGSGLFGEGLTVIDGRLLQLTWHAGRGLFYRLETLEPVGQLGYEGEGWGVTTVGKFLVMSNGSATLIWLNPLDLSFVKTLQVQFQGRPVVGLNELEEVGDRILANVWPRDCIVEIDPGNGRLTAWLDLSGLRPAASRQDHTAVANGIAYDPKRHQLYVTGKRWPYLYVLSVE